MRNIILQISLPYMKIHSPSPCDSKDGDKDEIIWICEINSAQIFQCFFFWYSKNSGNFLFKNPSWKLFSASIIVKADQRLISSRISNFFFRGLFTRIFEKQTLTYITCNSWRILEGGGGEKVPECWYTWLSLLHYRITEGT